MIPMSITLNYSPADLQLLKAQAEASNQSVEEFIMESSMKSARNAEYLAMLDKSRKQLQEGKVIIKTMEELEAMASE